jgi:WD40 repeat protein
MGVSQDRSCLEENSAVSVVPAAAPCTCVRWHPSQARPNSVLATYTTGQILLWRTDLQRVVERWSEHDNNITTCDFNARGEHFVTCGYDATVRVYDVERSGVHGTLRGGSIAAHTNRIYACKFLPQDSNVLLTAGWDRTLLLWDLRAGQA